jgi:hypothetical protein
MGSSRMDGLLSPDALHKLRAAVTSAQRDAEERLPPEYVKACREWYASLSQSGRGYVAEAVSALASGSEVKALRLAAALPSAPKCPLCEASSGTKSVADSSSHRLIGPL